VFSALADSGKFLADASFFTTLASGWTLGSSGSAPFLGTSFVSHFRDLAETFTMAKQLYKLTIQLELVSMLMQSTPKLPQPSLL